MIRPHDGEVTEVRWEFISTCTLTQRRCAAIRASVNSRSAIE